MSDSSVFENRLRKNVRHFRKWAARRQLTAYRLYDREVPDFPYTVEWFDGRVHLVEFPRRRSIREGTSEALREEVLRVLLAVLEVPRDKVFIKTHVPKQWRKEQYERSDSKTERFTVEENGLKFWVNLGEYLDTGLFLDHRNTRQRVREEARGKRFLNLFAYTGSFTVYAAAGGAARTTTVDLSNTYLDWAAENLKLNQLGSPRDELIRAEVVRWIREHSEKYDLIVLDPPSFSTSKSMTGTLDIQRDHPRLLTETLTLLHPAGTLYFSTNFQEFQLDVPQLEEDWSFEELTPRSLPEDVQFKKSHRCWRITGKSGPPRTPRR